MPAITFNQAYAIMKSRYQKGNSTFNQDLLNEVGVTSGRASWALAGASALLIFMVATIASFIPSIGHSRYWRDGINVILLLFFAYYVSPVFFWFFLKLGHSKEPK